MWRTEPLAFGTTGGVQLSLVVYRPGEGDCFILIIIFYHILECNNVLCIIIAVTVHGNLLKNRVLLQYKCCLVPLPKNQVIYLELILRTICDCPSRLPAVACSDL